MHDTVCALTCLNGTIVFIISYVGVILEQFWEVHQVKVIALTLILSDTLGLLGS